MLESSNIILKAFFSRQAKSTTFEASYIIRKDFSSQQATGNRQKSAILESSNII